MAGWLLTARGRMHSLALQRLQALRARAQELTRRLGRPGRFLDARRMRCDLLENRLEAAGGQTLVRARARLGERAARLTALNPLAVLARGYAAAADETGRAVTSVRMLAPGRRLALCFADGQARALVEDVKELPGAPAADVKNGGAADEKGADV